MPNRISEMSKGRYDIPATPWGGSNSSPYFHYALLSMKKNSRIVHNRNHLDATLNGDYGNDLDCATTHGTI